jgi:phytoene desaturase
MVSHYLKNDKLRQAFSIQPLLVGGNPFDTTSIYCLIHYLERAYGVQFAMGGTQAIVGALEQLMLRQGIEIRLNQTVERLVVDSDTVKGVVLEGGQVIEADIVVSNADPAYLYQHMIEPKKQSFLTRLKAKKSQYSMGLFVLYFGTTRTYSSIAHHTIWMGERYKELLADIFNRKILSEDFSLYLHRPTATDTSFAPDGCDSFYVLCPVPNLQGGQDEDFYMTPKDFEHDYLSEHGAGFSVSPIFTQSAWFRFHNRAESLKNLYLVGAGTHPGAGLPGVISSAKVVDALIPRVLPA